jgi:methylated-DNA-[protein]-cysteine S-methyltransferase
VLEEGEVSAQIPVFLRDAVQQLQEYFNSQRTDFTFKLNQKELIFNKSVERITDIPFGKTRTYLEQSKFLGDPKSRAVLPPMGKPTLDCSSCHRVIGSDGSLTAMQEDYAQKNGC